MIPILPFLPQNPLQPGPKGGERTEGLKKRIPSSNHPISTGLEKLYEGVTISSVTGRGYDPVMIGSHGQPVAAAWCEGGRRALVDGGFTRLFCNWDTAGTARYVKNAAAWLVNHERFG